MNVSQEHDESLSPRGGRGTLHLLYHELHPTPVNYAYALSKAEFARQLSLYSRLQRTKEDAIFPAVTFDDGHISNYEYALPELALAGITAHFFITAGWAAQRANYMNWSQLRELNAAGHCIGAHGWSHTLLTHCTAQQLQRELGDARLLLEDKLGISIRTMSLPGGRSSAEVLAACTRAGYTQVFTSVPRVETAKTPALVGRLNLRSDATAVWLENLLTSNDGSLTKMERQYRLKQAAQRALGDALYGKLWAVLNRARPSSESA